MGPVRPVAVHPRRTAIPLVWTLVLLLGAGGARALAGDSGASLRRPIPARVWQLPLAADSVRLGLPDRWIVPGSFVAILDGDTLRAGTDYALDAPAGVLRILRPHGTGRLRVEYRIVPLMIGRVFQQPIPLDTAGRGAEPISPRARSAQESPTRARLDLNGSKTVSLEVGSAQDLTVRQSLDVALAGEVVPGVTVRGVLSDRETPLQPEGRTTELSDLDKIFLQVDGPGASMTLGDFQLRGPPGLFTSYERQLEGIWLTGRRGNARGAAAAATVPGRFVTVSFLALEGKQGPYPLRPPNDPLVTVILAGSEHVWLDGEILVRGEDRDYMIDYAAGTLTFSGRRVVGKDSRVTVDFQASTESYRRSAYAAEIEWGTVPAGAAAPPEGAGLPTRGKKGGLRFRAGFLAERDDAARPIGGALTDRQREALRQAGDSLSPELGSGIDCRGSGYGDYIWVESDSLAQPFLRYVGPDSGSCVVRFEDAGERKGDYVDSLLSGGTRIYRFAGLRRGRFLPGRPIPKPSERDQITLAASWFNPSGIRLEVEGAGSLDDPNVLSSKDDADRTGGALRALLARDTGPLALRGHHLGRWGFKVETRDRDLRFHPLGRVDPGWYGYEWGLPDARLQKGDRRRQVWLRQEPGRGFAVEGSYETLSDRRSLGGERNRLTVRRVGKIHGSVDRLRARTRDRASGVRVPGERAIDAAGVGLVALRTESTLSLRREETTTGDAGARSGSGFEEWRASTAYGIPGEKGRIEIARTSRQDRQRSGDARWSKADRARTWEARTYWAPLGRVLDGRYTRRDLFRTDGSTSRSDVANLLWSEERGDGRFGQQVRADLSTSEEEGRVKAIQFVGTGRGRYDSLGVYIGTGDYDLVLIPSGSKNLERRLEASYRFDLAPGSGTSSRENERQGLAGRVWSTSQWLLYATFSARTNGSAALFWQDLPELLLARKAGVPLAFHRVRLEGSALPRARWGSPQVRLERERSASQAYENAQTDRRKDLLSVALRSTPANGLTLEQEIQGDREEETNRLLGATTSKGSIGWRSTRLRLAGWWKTGHGWTIRAAGVGRLRTRTPGDGKYRIGQLVPGVQWLPRGSSRLDFQATRTWVSGKREILLGLEKPGWEARGSFGVRLRRSLDGTAILDLRAPDHAVPRTSVRVEMKAFF